MSTTASHGPRIAVVGTCQVVGIGAALRHLVPGAELRLWHFIPSGMAAEEIAGQLASFDLVVTQLRDGEGAGVLDLSRLRDGLRQVAFVPPLVFRGCHPDCTYLLGTDGLLPGGLAGVHSAIIATSHVLGLPATRVPRLFNAFVYRALGYFEEWATSCEFMLRSFSDAGFDLEPHLPRWVAEPGGFMHTFNHPKIIALATIGTLIARKIGLAGPDTPVPQHLPDSLSDSARWPVYPELARQRGIAGGLEFVRSVVGLQAAEAREMSLAAFVESSYRTYDSLSPETLRHAVGSTRIEALQDLLRTREAPVRQAQPNPGAAPGSSAGHRSAGQNPLAPETPEQAPLPLPTVSVVKPEQIGEGSGMQHPPLPRFTFKDVVNNRRSNPNHAWDVEAPNTISARSRLHSDDFVAVHFEPKFRIQRSSSIFTIGSCFARNVEAMLHQHGLNVPTLQIALDQDAYVGPFSPNGVLNKYNTHSIESEMESALGSVEPENNGLLEVGDGKWWDPLSTLTKIGSFETTSAIRNQIKAITRKVVDCDAVIITLGLNEVWLDQETGIYANIMPPGEAIRKFGDRFAVILADLQENVSSLERTIALVRNNSRTDTKIVVTVSPVPMGATLSDMDVITANTYSKAMLRVCAQTVANRYDFVDYFPSYEMATHSPRMKAYMDDMLHVTPEMVTFITSCFVEKYIQG